MPYASSPSVRRLSKIATLLLARNYIVMLQRNVDELRRLLVHPDPSTRIQTGSQRAPSPYDGVKHSATASKSPAAHQDSKPLNVDAVQIPEIGSGCVLPPEVILAMTSLPSAVLNERFRAHLSMRQRERVGGALDWSAATAAMGWQQEMQRRSGVPLTPDSAAMIPGQCHPSMAAMPAGDRLLLPWIDCSAPIPLPAAAPLQPIQAASVTDAHRRVVPSF